MRVLHVIDKLSMDGINPSSCTVLFGAWYAHQQGPDFEMAVLSLAPDKRAGGYLRDRGIEVLYSPCPKFSFGNISYIAKLVRERSVDIVHLHGYGAAHFGRVAAKRVGALSVVHEHAVLKIKPHHFLVDRLLRNKTDLAIAVSEAVRQFMIRGRSVPSSRLRVIGNGVDLERFQQKTADSRSRARDLIGVGDQTPVVGTVTRLREEKGNADLIKAFRKIRDRIEDARLVVVGDGELRESLNRLADDLNLKDAIIWMGYRSDIERLMPAFDVQAVPSLSEGYGLVLVEAMAVGNPVVATQVGGMRELGRDGVDVLFVPPGDPEELSKACLQLLENRGLAATLASNGCSASKDMSIEMSSHRIRDAYEELLNKRSD
jgi:glycosyltransferase involved in cell wall biosynthesis